MENEKEAAPRDDDVSRAVMTVKFDGEALKGGTMDVEELAPSLLALADLVKRSNSLVNEDRANVRVKVSGGFRHGSFEFDVELWQTIIQRIGTLFTKENIQSAAELVEIVGLGGLGTGAVWLIKKLRNRKHNITVIEDNRIEITLEGNTFNVDARSYELSQDRAFRRYAERFVRPLKKAGIDVLETLASEAKEPQRITKDEVDAFDQVEDGADAGEVLHDGSSHQFFEIDNASFREGLVWRLKQGDDRITAHLLDDEFQQRIEDGERFGKGDVLEVDLKSVVRRLPDGKLDRRNEIIAVHTHTKC